MDTAHIKNHFHMKIENIRYGILSDGLIPNAFSNETQVSGGTQGREQVSVPIATNFNSFLTFHILILQKNQDEVIESYQW